MLRACVLVLVVFGCGRPAPVQPAADGPNWTHQELAAHLAQHGIRVRVESIPQYSTTDKVAAGLYEEAPARPMVLAYLCRDPQTARDQTGAMGAGAFAHGRFAIGIPPKRDEPADADLLGRVSAALK